MDFKQIDLVRNSLAISTVNDIAENMDAGIQTDAILLDFSKEFDRVAHSYVALS